MDTQPWETIVFSASHGLRDQVQDPLWYLQIKRVKQGRILGSVIASFVFGKFSIRDAAKSATESLYAALEQLLAEDVVALGKPGDGLYEFDSERREIDTIVIHHSHRAQGISLGRLNAMELLRLYVPVYVKPSAADAPRISGKPIYSGHEQAGRQVFYPYHKIIQQDGSVVRLLDDSQIGWQSGNWDLNTRSVAYCLDADLTHSAPNDAMLDALARDIRNEYGTGIGLGTITIQGHYESFNTDCPGDQFVAGANWKEKLLERIFSEHF